MGRDACYHCTAVWFEMDRRACLSAKPLSSGNLGALTDGAMAEIWEWTQSKLPAGIQVFDAQSPPLAGCS